MPAVAEDPALACQASVGRESTKLRGSTACAAAVGRSVKLNLCAGGVHGLRVRFRCLLKGFGIGETTYSPALLRPGGAISYHLRQDDLGRLLYPERWGCVHGAALLA